MDSWFSWPIVFYLSEWVIRLVMLAVVTRRRQPGSAMAWLLVIFVLPWPGLILYLLIGSNRLPRRRISEHSRLVDELTAIRNRFLGHPSVVHPELGPRSKTAVQLAERLGYLPILGGNDAELIADTDEVIRRLVDDIDAATEHVHLLFYIFADDETGRRVGDALVRAVQRGVTCRLLVDAAGSRPMLKTLAPRLIGQGVECHAMLPVNPFRRRVARIDLRNHRKIAVIDGRIGYTGSQNIVNASYGRKNLAWHDMMVRLTGPIVLELQAVFLEDWYFETDVVLDQNEIFPDPELTGNVPAQTLPSGPNYPTENYQRMVVAALHAAEKRVIITTPYFVPDAPFMQALETAVLRGVQVDLVVPRRSDQILVGLASRAYYDDVLEAGANLYLHENGLLHSKTMSIDDAYAFLGTSNFDIRSFALNFEVNLVFYGSPLPPKLREKQLEYIEDSARLTAEVWDRRPTRQKVLQDVAKLFSPLL